MLVNWHAMNSEAINKERIIEVLAPFAELLEEPEEFGDELALLWVSVEDIQHAKKLLNELKAT